ncbi:hypothetical protein DFO70_106367 [Cytobacillus firmus]|uniref:Uncharacterized protein n=2 Tax=Cytobacillus TaxID=2675230 RepID=A0A366JVN7_CYTFI|nr:hypothetical protein DFO70_106367 [Cytobacillus firmus]TDX42834.1 hypothetical protein DFO72_106367 [Cytobacillus oceanisediminis]
MKLELGNIGTKLPRMLHEAENQETKRKMVAMSAS